MWRNIASNALTLFIVALVVMSGILTWLRHDYVQPGPLASAICFKVDKGATISVVSQGLAQQGAVTQASVFRLGAEYSGRGAQLKFGSYLILPQASMEEIVADLTNGGQSTCG
ncbi:MAG: endolytic transglycosylase MltG, partial [Paracoccaceae bacterium]